MAVCMPRRIKPGDHVLIRMDPGLLVAGAVREVSLRTDGAEAAPQYEITLEIQGPGVPATLISWRQGIDDGRIVRVNGETWEEVSVRCPISNRAIALSDYLSEVVLDGAKKKVGTEVIAWVLAQALIDLYDAGLVPDDNSPEADAEFQAACYLRWLSE